VSEIVLETPDQLYAELAIDFMAENAGKYDFDRLVEIGKRLYEKNKARIAIAVCTSPNVREAYVSYKEKEDAYMLLAVIADVIAALTIGVSPIVAAKLTVKLGLEALCRDHWKTS